MPKYSIITPVYNHDNKRYLQLDRCISSVMNQGRSDYEHILIDQTENEDFIAEWCADLNNVRYFAQDHLERLFALRKGFEESTGEWICLLDSDDIYLPHYLETVDQMIEDNPEYKMFNFGSIHIHKDGKATVRDAFKPGKLEVGHEVFGGGNIVNGTFIFKRDVWKTLGDFPTSTDKLWNPWDFSIAAQEEFPELRQYFMVDHEDEPEKIAKELGNPWGQDFYLFYKYTRRFHSLPVDKHIYGVYCK